MDLNYRLKRFLPPAVYDRGARACSSVMRWRRVRRAAPKQRVIDEVNAGGSGLSLYLGNLHRTEAQFGNGFIGLALYPQNEKEIEHNLLDPLPFAEGVVGKVQAQDVLEHVPYERAPAVLNEVCRVLAKGGIFRLSVPDYRSPVLRQRSVFNHDGRILADLMMGGSVHYDWETGLATPSFTDDGDAHLWFPTYEIVQALIDGSELRHCASIEYYHYFISDDEHVVRDFPDLGMPVRRAPPNDMRADGAPVSIIVDFRK